MNSKEALERIDKILESPITKARGGSYLDIEFIKSIKQDLDRLEQLEDNIKIHKETIKMQQNQIESLQSENKKLKDKIYNYQLCKNITEPFNELNKKKLKQLENAIDILKGRVCVHNRYVCYEMCADIPLKDDEIELLEKVLGGE